MNCCYPVWQNNRIVLKMFDIYACTVTVRQMILLAVPKKTASVGLTQVLCLKRLHQRTVCHLNSIQVSSSTYIHSKTK